MFQDPTRLIYSSLQCSAVSAAAFLSCFASIHGAENASLFPDARQVPMLSPEETLATMRFAEPGYRLEIVASEPMIEEPVLIEWDAKGRLYVAEMLTYMQNIDGTEELVPRSRVSRLEDTDGDGRMDKSTVFADDLLLPRMVLALDDEIIIRETGTFDLWSYRDTNDDGVADKKTLWHKGGPRGGNLEHQPSGLIWNLDNWIYTTYSPHRYRYTRGKVERESLTHRSGQWGIAKDDIGKLYYSTAGGETPALDFQQPIVYGKIRIPGELGEGFRICWPIDDIPDTQGGRRRLRDDNTLNWFTGVAGQSVYRGDQLPQDFYGNLIIPEPVGRLIRRAKILNQDGKTVLENAYDQEEFIASSDPNFRPVNSATGPDGCLYIVDMYRGIIQEGAWVREGSYLRPVVAAYGLDKNIGRGRIYRVVHENYRRPSLPNLHDDTTSELVANLNEVNGWKRDTAQKLLILRKDPEAAPLLRTNLQTAKDWRGRLHALWTLEGLDAIEKSDLLGAMKDPSWQVQAAAIRIAEPWLARNDQSLAKAAQQLAQRANPNVAIQAVLSFQHARVDEKKSLIEELLTAHVGNEAIGQIVQGFEDQDSKRLQQIAQQDAIKKENRLKAAAIVRGQANYRTLCFACHGEDGLGTPIPDTDLTMAPSLANSKRVQGSIQALTRVLLHGLTGPVDGKNYAALMVPMASFEDQWIADVLSFIRNQWGNEASVLEETDVKAIREQTKERLTPWTQNELAIFNSSEWILTASHGKRSVRAAIDGNSRTRFSTGQPQKPGMWFQVEFPSAILVKKITLDTTRSANDWPQKYEITYSSDGETWSEPILKGVGERPLTEIRLKPVIAKKVRITQTGSKSGLHWSIHELKVE
jgi:mono/diheme cytochrome c family protein/glucose/arabinose dehydrogenase